MLIRQFAAAVLCGALLPCSAFAVELKGESVQGNLMFGQAEPGSTVSYNGKAIMVSPEGHFVIGFGRDDTGSVSLVVAEPGSGTTTLELKIAAQEYNIERVDGLPPRTVTPDPEALERIREEQAMVVTARSRRDQRSDFATEWAWPAEGRLSGFYGSQRVLNGEPRRPHYGIDVAAPEGTPVYAPADGVITLAHPDMYFSGGTIVLDHGHGLTSSFLHLSAIEVESGTTVRKGDLIGRIGMTGRATGPHLDWRMNWLDKRVNPQPLVGEMPAQSAE